MFSINLIQQSYPTSLMTTTFPLKRATWHVPVDQITVSERGAAAEVDQTSEKSKLSIPSSPSKKSRSPDRVSSGIVKDVALKVIPKKKVKESEANVWGEMEVLKGLDHPNIVSIDSIIYIVLYPGLIFPSGQILRMV